MQHSSHSWAERASRLAAMLGLALCITAPCLARTVVDEVGRTVVVPEHPQRIVCLIPSVVDDLYAMGARDLIVAVSDFSVYPPEAKAKRSIGSPLSPSIETIISLHPDLVLAEADLNPASTLPQLEKARLTVYYIQPHGLEGIYRSIRNLGVAINRVPQARALEERLRARVAAVQKRVAGEPRVRVMLPIWHDPALTIGRRSFLTELIELAGGHSVTADLPEEWPQVSMESVVARGPEAILLVRGSPVTAEMLRKRPGWSSLPAVRNNRFYYTDQRLESPSPAAFEALEELARKFHP